MRVISKPFLVRQLKCGVLLKLGLVAKTFTLVFIGISPNWYQQILLSIIKNIYIGMIIKFKKGAILTVKRARMNAM